MLSVLKKQPNWSLVVKIAKEVQKVGGRALVVGGSVRDAWLKQQGKDIEVKDFDVEVYGLKASDLKRLLGRMGRVIEIGRQFGVFNLKGIDIALPRTDSRTGLGLGRKPRVVSQPDLEFKEASRRRDLTINALAVDPLTGEVLDAHGGLKDLRKGILRAVDPIGFGDDPLRVLRVMQFVARFNFKIHPETLALCKKISLKQLAKERVGEEWRKMLLKASKPSLGLKAAKELGVLRKLHPELAALNKQDWECLLASADRCLKYVLCENRLQAHFAILSYWLKGEQKIRKFLMQVDYLKSGQISVLALVASVKTLSKRLSDYEVRKTALHLSRHGLHVSDVVVLCKVLGLTGLAKHLQTMAERLKVLYKAPKLLVQGRDLIKIGLQPGPEFSKILSQVTNLQLRGEFDEPNRASSRRRALKWIKEYLSA